MSELKPCPFCGGTDLEVWFGGIFRPTTHVIHCNTCELETGIGTDQKQSKESLVAAWNRRVKEKKK